MTYIAKPKFHHPSLPKNELGFTHRDYEGKISTLCAGCGHDSITASIIEACFELSLEPHSVATISGRIASRSCRVLAARPRRRIISWARATASIRCMAACRAC